MKLIHCSNVWKLFEYNISSSTLSYERTLAYTLLIDPKTRVLNKLFLFLAIIIVLRSIPKIIILIVLIVLCFVYSSLYRFVSTLLSILDSCHPSIYHQIVIFRLRQFKLDVLDLYIQILLFRSMFENLAVLFFDYCLHLYLFLF